MTTILLTGFEPFDGALRNPSWDAVERVAEEWTGPEEVRTRLLPVAFARAGAAIADAVRTVDPDVVVAVGLAEGRTAITPERVAVNLDDARIPDADGDQPVDRAVLPDAPAAFFTTLPVKRMAAAALDAGAPAALSSTAGAYVCNHVFTVLQALGVERPGMRSGFVHVPATPETRGRSSQASGAGASGAAEAAPTVELDVLVRGLAAAVRAAADATPDLATPSGAIA